MRKIFLLLALCLTSVFAAQAGEKKVYTVFDKVMTLTYYYDDQYDSRPGIVEFYDPSEDDRRFKDYYESVEVVVIDASMKNAHLTSTKSMFKGYLGLQNMVLIQGMENLVTDEVTDMSEMFAKSNALKSVDLSHFNTAKVTTMEEMFYKSAVRTVDMTSFDVSKLTNTLQMFCKSGVRTIKCNEDWTKKNITKSAKMFYKCTELVGGNGTEYDKTHDDIAYARPDEGTSKPGYFTLSSKPEPVNKVYSVFYNFKLTYYYDDQYDSRSGIVEEYDPTKNRFASYWQNVKSAEIDASMKYAPLTSMKYLFYGGSVALENMEFINDMANLNSDDLTETYGMFYGCAALKSVYLYGFNMKRVTDARNMFSGCTALTTITCNEDWSQYTKMTQSDNMFAGCTSLVGGKDTPYSSGNKTDKTLARPDGGAAAPGYFTKTSEIVSTLVFKDFKEKITLGMPWTYEAGSAIASGITPVKEGAPYLVNSKNFALYSWVETQSKYAAVSTSAGQKLAPGKYYFLVQIIIPEENRQAYRLPNDADDLDIFVDGDEWEINSLIGLYLVNAQSPEFILDESTDIEKVLGDKVQGTKIIRDGHLYILRNGKTYTVQGAEVK